MTMRIITASILALGLATGVAYAKQNHHSLRSEPRFSENATVSCPAGQKLDLGIQDCVPLKAKVAKHYMSSHEAG